MKKVKHLKWAEFRFSVIGNLLACPPDKGDLKESFRNLANKIWKHPISGQPFRVGLSTIERWYYIARQDNNPVEVLRRKVRSDAGQFYQFDSLCRSLIRVQYKTYSSWSYKLHSDNLNADLEKNGINEFPSYSTVLRYMHSKGYFKKKRSRNKNKPGYIAACEHFEHRETRLYEAEFVNSLWHLDFHHGSLQIIEPDGKWYTPLCLCILDDRSRLACHVQWFLAEDTASLVHGIKQSFQKRGLPRELMSDNGSAMTSEEFTQGLLRLSIQHITTLPYSPHQNGKQEYWWSQLEGRLLAMLENHKSLTLKFLNDTTQAWVEIEYNRSFHSEIGYSPIECISKVKDVGRQCPEEKILKESFLRASSRIQRRSDGTISLEGIRFEIPSQYRHLKTIHIRYCSWDLSKAIMVDQYQDKPLCIIYPVDKTKNATSGRRSIEAETINYPIEFSHELPALLQKLVKQYSESGLPPAYLPLIENQEI